MAAPDWVSYTGMLTGLAGAVVAILAFKRSGEIKSLDLRVSCKKDIVELDELIDSLRSTFEKSKESRPRILSAIGKFRSGSMVVWQQQVDADMNTIQELLNRRDTIQPKIDQTDPVRLEALLVNVHEIKVKVISLLDKYENELKKDEIESNRLKDSIHNQ